MKPHVVRVYDPLCKRPVWQAWITHEDGTKEWIASSHRSLRKLAEGIEDWELWERAQRKVAK